jgi:uncharacterized protein
MADIRPLRDILAKPAGPDCNMACAYCFYSGRCSLFGGAPTHRMGEAVLEEMIRQVMSQSGPEVSIGWQGGEPTLMGREFFEKAVKLETRFGRGKVVGNGLQTNGILVDRAWARFFKEFSFLIGLSIDGPEHIHDRYRRTKRGRGSWARVTDSARLMLDEGVSVNALTVVNDYSVRFPEEIYEFHKGLGLTYMQFIPCVEIDPERPGAIAPFSVSPEAYGAFLCAVFDLWRADFVDGVPTTSIRFFESLLFAYAGFPAPECTLDRQCGPYVVVEHNGDVYSCDFFVEPRWKLGNIMDGNLTEMLNSPVQDEFGRRKSDLPPSCIACTWLGLCRGGCTKDRAHNPRDPRVNYLCGAFRLFFAHADGDMRLLVAEWRKRQRDRGPV